MGSQVLILACSGRTQGEISGSIRCKEEIIDTMWRKNPNTLLWVIYADDVDYFIQLCKDFGLTQGKSSVLLFVVKGNDHVFELGAC